MYLKEIQGLRVFAALLVAVYHIWFGRVSGGVDAFFVIAGFFVYQSFFKSGGPGWDDVLRLYKRTAARIVPSASIVILATCVGFLVLQVDSLWVSQIKSALASILFVENWRLALASVDYLAQGVTPSPFQQMWALSVQVQMYLILPLLLYALATVLRRLRLSQGWFAGGVALLLAASFVYALVSVARDQAFAYFDTFARMWEFLAGVMLAFCLPMLRLGPVAAKRLGYAALIVLGGFAMVIPVGNSFPGLAAVVPVLATAAVIVAASNHAGMGLLTNPLMQRLGDLSFTFYLWHWPILVAVWMMTGERSLGLGTGLAIIVAAGLLAWATYALAERPFRRSAVASGPILKALLASAVLMLPAVGAAGFWAWRYVEARDTATRELIAFRRGGTARTVVPGTVIARQDLANGARGCIQTRGHDTPIECVFGDREGGNTFVLVGGSHSQQWLPAFELLAAETPGMRIILMTKGNCPLTLSDDGVDLHDSANCLSWNRQVLDRIRDIRPAAVVSLLSWTSVRASTSGGSETIPDGFREAWAALEDTPVLAIRDNPRAPFDFVNCVARAGPEATECAVTRDSVMDDSVLTAAPLPDNVRLIDLTDLFCDAELCRPVEDNILRYRDDNHISATFARSLAPELRRWVDPVLVRASLASGSRD